MTTKDVLALALEALEESIDDVRTCLNEVKFHAGYPKYDRQIAAYEAQIVKHEAAITAIKQAITPEIGNAANPEASAITAGNGQQVDSPVGKCGVLSKSAGQQAQEPVKREYKEAAIALNDAWLYHTGAEPSESVLARAIERAASLLLTAPKQAEPAWQPIESAPKDFVTEFDGWNGERVPNVSWAHPEYSPKGHYAWCLSEYEHHNGWVNTEVKGLTHWLPLPTPPEAA